MHRVMVIGCCGSGKSTFSRKLATLVELPIIHLDQFYWKPNWTETPRAEWESIVGELAQKSNWIIDGNYGGTMHLRIKRADTIIFLDRSNLLCLWRVIKRIIKYKGTVRPDMPEGCRERFDWNFLHYVAVFNLTRRKAILKKIMRQSHEKDIIILKSDKAAEKYLRKLKQQKQ